MTIDFSGAKVPFFYRIAKEKHRILHNSATFVRTFCVLCNEKKAEPTLFDVDVIVGEMNFHDIQIAGLFHDKFC